MFEDLLEMNYTGPESSLAFLNNSSKRYMDSWLKMVANILFDYQWTEKYFIDFMWYHYNCSKYRTIILCI